MKIKIITDVFLTNKELQSWISSVLLYTWKDSKFGLWHSFILINLFLFIRNSWITLRWSKKVWESRKLKFQLIL